MDDARDWLELSLIPGIGPKTFFRLVDHFGNVRSVLEAPRSALAKVPDVGRAISEAVHLGCKTELDKTLDLIEKHDVDIVTFDSPSYPEHLKHIHDPPPVLYVKGSLSPADRRSISIVGSRRATHYGKMVAGRLAGDLARIGVTVTSGLAYGIDAAAHKGALAAGGRTIAVLGCGVDVVYPRANSKIYDQVPSAGALISEYPMGCQPDPRFFPLRNRIISGISLGTLVVEAPRKSGALITATQALEQGREVFAVPGNVYSPYSEGCHKLIKDGAKLVETVYDIISEVEGALGDIGVNEPVQPEAARQSEIPMSEDEKKVFNYLSMAPVHIDEIAEECDLTASRTASALMTLELKGLAQQISGKRFTRRA